MCSLYLGSEPKAHTSRRSLICRHNRIKEKHEYEPPRYNTLTCSCQGHAVSSENLCVLLLLLFSLYLALILIIRQAQNNHFTQSRSLKAPDRTSYLRMLTQTMGGDAQRIQIDLNSPIQAMHRKQQMTFTNVILQCGAHRLGTGSLCLAPFVLLAHITLYVHAVSLITSNVTSLLEMCHKVHDRCEKSP